jgi:hypothetical protein
LLHSEEFWTRPTDNYSKTVGDFVPAAGSGPTGAVEG